MKEEFEKTYAVNHGCNTHAKKQSFYKAWSLKSNVVTNSKHLNQFSQDMRAVIHKGPCRRWVCSLRACPEVSSAPVLVFAGACAIQSLPLCASAARSCITSPAWKNMWWHLLSSLVFNIFPQDQRPWQLSRQHDEQILKQRPLILLVLLTWVISHNSDPWKLFYVRGSWWVG